jgi:hypothetical protein
MNSDFLILVLYDFIVQNILSSLLLLCYNLMIMNDYEYIINTVFILHSSNVNNTYWNGMQLVHYWNKQKE